MRINYPTYILTKELGESNKSDQGITIPGHEERSQQWRRSLCCTHKFRHHGVMFLACVLCWICWPKSTFLDKISDTNASLCGPKQCCNHVKFDTLNLLSPKRDTYCSNTLAPYVGAGIFRNSMKGIRRNKYENWESLTTCMNNLFLTVLGRSFLKTNRRPFLSVRIPTPSSADTLTMSRRRADKKIHEHDGNTINLIRFRREKNQPKSTRSVRRVCVCLCVSEFMCLSLSCVCVSMSMRLCSVSVLLCGFLVEHTDWFN